MPSVALLDVCVLYPVTLRDTLLRLTEVGLYVPLWSDDIVDETRRSILRDRPDLTAAGLDKMFSAMALAFPGSRVEGYQELVSSINNDPGDRHVLAAAVAGGAGVIVTHNVGHSPRRLLLRGPSRFSARMSFWTICWISTLSSWSMC